MAAEDARLKEYRQSIDNIDAALIYLLSERFKVTQKVGQLKKECDLAATDESREAEQFARLRGIAEAAQLDPAFSEKFIRMVIDEVVRNHEQIRAAE